MPVSEEGWSLYVGVNVNVDGDGDGDVADGAAASLVSIASRADQG